MLVGGGGGGEPGCDDEGGGMAVLEGGVEDRGVVTSWRSGVIIVPLPLSISSSGSWTSILHSELIQHLLI